MNLNDLIYIQNILTQNYTQNKVQNTIISLELESIVLKKKDLDAEGGNCFTYYSLNNLKAHNTFQSFTLFK